MYCYIIKCEYGDLMNDKQFKRNKFLLRVVISLIMLVLVLGLIYLIFKKAGLMELSQEEIQIFIQQKGALAPLIFILITFLQVTFIPIPSTLTVLVGNYLFGFWVSYLYSFIGMMIGSVLAFYLGRWFGKKFIYWLVSDKEMVDSYLYKIKNKGNVMLFFMFIFPFFPDDLLCSVAGVLPISGLSFTIMQVFTRGITILTTLFMLSGDVIPFSGWGIPFNICLTLILMTSFYISYKNAEVISSKFSKIINKFKRKKDK